MIFAFLAKKQGKCLVSLPGPKGTHFPCFFDARPKNHTLYLFSLFLYVFLIVEPGHSAENL